MHLSNLPCVVWICFFISCIVASPVRDGIEKRAEHTIASGRLRFGIELETILVMQKGGRAYQRLGKSISEAPKKSEQHEKVHKAVRGFLVEMWKHFELTEDMMSPWLKDAKRKQEIAAGHVLSYPKQEMEDRWGLESTAESYRRWSITKDATIKASIKDWQFAIEFVSPIMEIGATHESYLPARYQIEYFFQFIKYCGFDYIKDESIATHVHVSPAHPDWWETDEWTSPRVIQMASSALFFEPAMRTLLPPYAYQSPFAKEWRDPTWMEKMGTTHNKMADKKQLIDTIRILKIDKPHMRIQDFMAMMNPMAKATNPLLSGFGMGNDDDDDGDLNRARGRNGEDTKRYWGWNFWNLEPGKKMTIEYRKGGWSTSAEEAMLHIELATGFSLAACDHGDWKSLLMSYDFTAGSLKRFIRDGIPKLTPSSGSTTQEPFYYPVLENKFSTIPDQHDESKRVVKYDRPLF